MGRRNDGRAALRQALWLREKAQDHKRAHVLRALLLAMESALAQETVVSPGQHFRGEFRHLSRARPAMGAS